MADRFESALRGALMEANLSQYRDALESAESVAPAFSPRYRRECARMLSDPFGWMKRKLRPLWKMALPTAACILLVMAGGAEAASGSVSNLLAPLYGGARTEIIDRIGKPVGASATADGYTITAEAVIGDRHNLAIVYTLTRDDGEALPERLSFEDYHNSAQIGSGGGILGVSRTDDLPANQARIVAKGDSELLMFWRQAKARFQNLRVSGADEYETLAEGPWELNFTLRYPDTTVNMPLREKLTVYDEFHGEYVISKIQISAFAVQMKLTAPNPDYIHPEKRGANPFENFTVSVRLKNGDEVKLSNSASAHGATDSPTWKASYNGRFPEPLIPSEIESLIICGAEVPVNLE